MFFWQFPNLIFMQKLTFLSRLVCIFMHLKFFKLSFFTMVCSKSPMSSIFFAVLQKYRVLYSLTSIWVLHTSKLVEIWFFHDFCLVLKRNGLIICSTLSFLSETCNSMQKCEKNRKKSDFDHRLGALHFKTLVEIYNNREITFATVKTQQSLWT